MKPDAIDFANEIAQMRVDQAVASKRINRNAVSATQCEECGEDIPAPRRAAVPGCQTCAECQKEIELRNKQRGS